MNIISKFDYAPLERVDHPSGRRYIVGEGRPLPSVTTILSKTKDMTFLKEWRAKVGEAEATRITTEAAGIGSGMHANLEKYILGKEMTGNLISQILASVIIKQGLTNVDEIWGIEVGLYSKELYAGTTDLVGVHKGTPAIMDFKNSRAAKKKEWIEDYFMQLAAYALSHNEMHGTTINKGVIMLATRDAKYQEFIIEGDEFTYYETMWANKVCSYYNQFGIS
jgi:CRISPR/Cas system-associated exonuclease Cas4 (RecB family)